MTKTTIFAILCESWWNMHLVIHAIDFAQMALSQDHTCGYFENGDAIGANSDWKDTQSQSRCRRGKKRSQD